LPFVIDERPVVSIVLLLVATATALHYKGREGVVDKIIAISGHSSAL